MDNKDFLLQDVRTCQYEAKSGSNISVEAITLEVPIEIEWGDGLSTRLWAWPEDLEILALGHVLLEQGGLGHRAKVKSIGPFKYRVNLYEKLAEKKLKPKPLSATRILELASAFIKKESVWNLTGCLHRAGIYSSEEDRMLVVVEDIGRHNCLDRLVGWSAKNETPLGDKTLFISARITASISKKIAKAGIKFVVSKAAVSSAALEIAAKHNITLIGFCRGNSFTIYADPSQLILL